MFHSRAEPALNIRHLAALAATVRHGSVTRAARAINLTQPALTQAIARLETDLGCALFERGASGMTATPLRCCSPRVPRRPSPISALRA
jgi:molybdenum-dependent DNA-binding transcriptional regulator ModE